MSASKRKRQRLGLDPRKPECRFVCGFGTDVVLHHELERDGDRFDAIVEGLAAPR
jgi:hypothetical protein